jgi:hypothetical protein
VSRRRFRSKGCRQADQRDSACQSAEKKPDDINRSDILGKPEYSADAKKQQDEHQEENI